ncbi:two-component response regulator-like APRR1 isoform X2 [Cucurbita maxima]|uniref:Two-component response regulator-like APRR1 isoform X2 n=1 Tax=Cucurbita maxima TaxID=3661 RepID=A0A6J1I4Z8_CUCMA|nr:two-component response regulator-like APRR1 isoform X2 [Cucurbita maxima]
MECKEINSNKDCGVGESNRGGGGAGFVDRSKVKILLCDNDSKSSQEVFTLLLRCSYQVISVRSARQVINALNAEGPDIDIILTEVDLPMAKGMKMLKYVTRDKELRRIPVIMMSAQDEVSVVVKCLRLGAADYLVKPLRTNELLNLWTHIWRRRRMLGLTEKQILNFDFDLATSDLSDRNTNSTTFLSDDTDDNTHRSINPELDMPHQEDMSAVADATAMDPPAADSLQFQPNVHFIDENHNGPKKCKLKIGKIRESSAFFTYCKPNALKSNFQAPPAQQLRREENPLSSETDQLVSTDHSQGDGCRSSISVPDSWSMEMSSSPQTFQFSQPMSHDEEKLQFSQQMSHDEEKLSQVVEHPRDESRPAGLLTQTKYPFYLPGGTNQVLIPPSTDFYHCKNQHDGQNHVTAAAMPQYSHFHHFPLASGMPPFPYYPLNICLQPSQMPSSHPWPPSFGNSSSTEVKLSKADIREAALIKFRQKRKERCFDKKIRYENRKQLAEKRPRVRGQFVRNGANVDLNGQPSSTGNDNDDDETL